MKLSQALRYSDPPTPRQPGVYIVRRSRDGACKIGMSEDLETRIETILQGCGRRAEVVHVVRTAKPRELEAHLHRVFRAAALGGEWFRLLPEDIERLRSFDRWPREK